MLTDPSSSATALPDPMIGTVLAERYRVYRVIGQGGMGVVYEAEHIQLGKKVAIKLLLAKFADDREAVARFQREALTVSQIGNSHIIEVLDIGQAPDGRSFVVLELLVGYDLGDALRQTGPMPAQRAIAIMQQVLEGVGAAHARGIVHRDLKPDNVFLLQRGSDRDFVKILDFGISKIIDAQDAKVRLTSTGTVVGTPIYMAPEQAMGGAIDHRADLYALGVMFYELLAGAPPFDAPNYIALVTKHLHEEPRSLAELRPDLPTWLVAVVHRALEKEPSRRFANAEAFLNALPSRSTVLSAADLGDLAGSQVPLLPELSIRAPARTPSGSKAARPASNTVPPEFKSSSKLPWIILACGLVAAATAVTVVVLTNRSTAPANSTAVAPAVSANVGSAVPQPLPPPPPVATVGVMEIKTIPAGAKVFVDDKLVGVTNLESFETSGGNHTVRLELDGYEPVETVQGVDVGDTVSLVVPLSRRTTVVVGPGSGAGSAAAPVSIKVERRHGRKTKPGQIATPGGTPIPTPGGTPILPPPPVPIPVEIKPPPVEKPPETIPGTKHNPFKNKPADTGATKPNPFGSK